MDNNIIIEDIRSIAKEKYLTYAMSVIVDRALPDIRDGLKPVHRRVLYSMNELGIVSDKPHKKSARVVGDVIGKYHPHGDTAVYDTMVRMGQPFSMRALLIDGQGNFGSIDGDSPAAMRYTEARLHKFAESMFDDIGYDTVDFVPNYDGSENEPSVLPLSFPNLLINGVQGIAVGMATNIPPHNPIEVMECVKYMVNSRLNKTEASLDILKTIVTAPDFPTGGILHGAINMHDAWTTGRASLRLRAKWFEEELDNGRTSIVITEIPYQVNKATLIEKISELATVVQDKNSPNFGKSVVEGIYDIQDESDSSGLRVVVFIKPEFEAELVFNQLLKYTNLDVHINYNATVLVDNKPEVVGIYKILEKFIEHRLEVIERRTKFKDAKAAHKELMLDAVIKAVDPKNIENVISLIRASKNNTEAKEGLIQLLTIVEEQAEYILDLKLSKLTSLQIDDTKSTLQDILIERQGYAEILSSEENKYKVILEESEEKITMFINHKEKMGDEYVYPYRSRKTEVVQNIIRNDLAALTKEEYCNIMLSSQGYLARVSLDTFESQNRGTRGKKFMKMKKDDYIKISFNSHSHSDLLFISDIGKTYSMMAYQIPDSDKGRHIKNVLELSSNEEKILKIISVDFEKDNQYLVMVTKNGQIKKTDLKDYLSSKRKGGVIGINLKEGDEIVFADVCEQNDEIFLINNKNLSIRFPLNTIRDLSRNSSGVTAMALADDSFIINGSIVKEGALGYVVCITDNGLAKTSPVSAYRLQSRGGKGVRAMKMTEKGGDIFAAIFIDKLENNDIMSITKKGFSNRISLDSVKVKSRNTQGITLLNLDKNDKLTNVFIVDSKEEDVVGNDDNIFEDNDTEKNTLILENSEIE